MIVSNLKTLTLGLLLIGSTFFPLYSDVKGEVKEQENLPNRSQDKLIEKQESIHPSFFINFNFRRYSGLLTSYYSNLFYPDKEYLAEHDFHEQFIKNDEGYTRRAYVHLPKRPRPMIICLSGIGGAVNASHTTLCSRDFRRYYDWGLILLENSTSPEWIERNNRLVISGYEAGWDVYLTIKAILKNPNYANLISEIHLIGFSLGGNDISFASYFDTVLETNYIDGSVLAISGPADRYDALRVIRKQEGIAGDVIRNTMRVIYRAAYDIIAEYKTITEEEFVKTIPVEELMAEIFYPLALEYLKDHPHHYHTLAGIKSFANDPEDFANSISFLDFERLYNLKQYLPYIEKPLLYFHASNDPIVAYTNPVNTLSVVAGKPNIGHRVLWLGGHVGFHDAYGANWFISNAYTYIQYWGNYEPKYYRNQDKYKDYE